MSLPTKEADRERLTRRVTEWLDPDGKRKITHLQLSIVEGPGRSDPCALRPVSHAARKDAEDRARACALVVDDLMTEASNWAEGAPRLQRFTIGALTSAESDQAPVDMAVFNVSPTGDMARVEDNGETRKYAEGWQFAGQHMQEMMTDLRAENARLRRENAEMLDKRAAGIIEREQLLSQKAERDLLAERERFKLELMQQGVSAGLLYLKSKLDQAEGAVEPKRLAVDPEAVVRFWHVLKPEQVEVGKPVFDAIMGSMTPDERREMKRISDEARQLAQANQPAATEGSAS